MWNVARHAGAIVALWLTVTSARVGFAQVRNRIDSRIRSDLRDSPRFGPNMGPARLNRVSPVVGSIRPAPRTTTIGPVYSPGMGFGAPIRPPLWPTTGSPTGVAAAEFNRLSTRAAVNRAGAGRLSLGGRRFGVRQTNATDVIILDPIQSIGGMPLDPSRPTALWGAVVAESISVTWALVMGI